MHHTFLEVKQYIAQIHLNWLAHPLNSMYKSISTLTSQKCICIMPLQSSANEASCFMSSLMNLK